MVFIVAWALWETYPPTNRDLLEEFKSRMDENLRLLRNSARMEGCERIYTAGEREWECEQDRRANGVPIHPNTIAALQKLASETDVATHAPSPQAPPAAPRPADNPPARPTASASPTTATTPSSNW